MCEPNKSTRSQRIHQRVLMAVYGTILFTLFTELFRYEIEDLANWINDRRRKESK